MPIDPSRSDLMSRVRQRDTGPELVVRSVAHALGYRFRVHRKDLPGRPDIVFPSRRKVVLVHGCFWHRHCGCPKSTTPKTRRGFWQRKFTENKRRDLRNIRHLRRMGWGVLVVWECETPNRLRLARVLRRYLR
ncbi:MAG TPA: very short patch repair endonuclease [Xanthobacteraceae bacterium]|nr:very short patch repair endonuclease [Xanthobacteraceae bacterium]